VGGWGSVLHCIRRSEVAHSFSLQFDSDSLKNGSRIGSMRILGPTDGVERHGWEGVVKGAVRRICHVPCTAVPHVCRICAAERD